KGIIGRRSDPVIKIGLNGLDVAHPGKRIDSAFDRLPFCYLDSHPSTVPKLLNKARIKLPYRSRSRLRCAPGFEFNEYRVRHKTLGLALRRRPSDGQKHHKRDSNAENPAYLKQQSRLIHTVRSVSSKIQGTFEL